MITNTLYNKQVLARELLYYDSRYVEVFVLDDKDYYNIHVLDDEFQSDELNTLKLQEPKEAVSLEEVTNPIRLECQALEHILWAKYYGKDNKMYSFNVSIAEEYPL